MPPIGNFIVDEVAWRMALDLASEVKRLTVKPGHQRSPRKYFHRAVLL